MLEGDGYLYPQARILVFAKQPIAGEVKTRLAVDIGNERAVSVYKQLTHKTLRMSVASKVAPVELVVTPDENHSFFDELKNEYPITISSQKGNDLGERMREALRRINTGFDFGVLIGTDCPVMDAEYLQQAAENLASGDDVVIGPAEDGGYVLIGTSGDFPGVFENIAWGKSEVLATTRLRVLNLSLRCTELELLWDIDDKDDFERYQKIK